VQPEYLARLSEPIQNFVRDTEACSGLEITVVLDAKQNDGGSNGQGKLAIEIEAQRVLLFAPTNGYFPDGAVRHEVLHVERFHCKGIPKLVLADSASWNEAVSQGLCALDNAIEHVVIVPVELQLHPDRREHWEAVVKVACAGLSEVPEPERRLAVCMHWTFLVHALPCSPSIQVVKEFADDHGLLETASRFAERFVSVAGSKEDAVRFLFDTFPELPKSLAALEYISAATGSHQVPIA
jgi:hypothetical protein